MQWCESGGQERKKEAVSDGGGVQRYGREGGKVGEGGRVGKGRG